VEGKERQAELANERWALLANVDAILDKPLIALSFAWLALLVVELVYGLSSTVEWLVYIIWAIFVLDFVLEFIIAPDRGAYLRSHWLTALSLALPALRVFTIFRAWRVLSAARAARGLNLLRWLTSVNRGMAAVRETLGRRGIGFVLVTTALVAIVSAAGILYFENPAAVATAGEATGGAGIEDYGDALWWTAMLLTTIGSEYWPRTAEGRILSWLLSLYAFAVFGYITAALAAHFVGTDPQGGRAPAARMAAELGALGRQVDALAAQVSELNERLARRPGADTHERER
jgi:voltage-gated potassium channel